MPFHVTLPRFGAEVLCSTAAEVRELLETIYPLVEIRIDQTRPDLRTLSRSLLDEAKSTPLPPPRKKRASRPQPDRDRTFQANTPEIERGILGLLQDGPRSGRAIADAAGLAQVTITRYIRTLERDGKIHQQGAGRLTKWALGRRPKEEP